jgi:hypothetical protein
MVQGQLLAACAELTGVKLAGAAPTGAELPKESRS